MKFDINALIQKQKRPIKDKKQLSAELKKTIEQEEDPRIQKHKINALKNIEKIKENVALALKKNFPQTSQSISADNLVLIDEVSLQLHFVPVATEQSRGACGIADGVHRDVGSFQRSSVKLIGACAHSQHDVIAG